MANPTQKPQYTPQKQYCKLEKGVSFFYVGHLAKKKRKLP